MKKERKTARQILSENPREVISVGPADAVLTALRLMADKDVTTVLVLHGSNLVGIVSQRDYARKVELDGRSAAETKVGEITTTQVFYVQLPRRMELHAATKSAQKVVKLF